MPIEEFGNSNISDNKLETSLFVKNPILELIT